VDEFDGPWKEAIEEWFEQFLLFFFPLIHGEIDWSKGYEFLDKELQQLAPESATGPRTVDKLIKVVWKSGAECWILVHIEVQAQAETSFPRRMYVYRYRIDDKFNRPIVSLAILADDELNWRPDEYRESLAGCELRFRFPIVKLLDFASREEWLEEQANPFAIVTLSHLKTQQTHRDPDERTVWKIRLLKGLYNRGYEGEQIRRLLRLIDWLLRLPKEMDKIVWAEIEALEQEKRMPYVSSIEQIGIEKGIEQGIELGTEKGLEKGIRAGITVMLESRFGPEGSACLPEIAAVANSEQLMRILHGLPNAKSVEEARRLWS
jgi:hypothetical protein